MMRLLVLDDDDATGRLVVRVAKLAGVEAVAVATAEAFASHLRTDPPQIVMLDLQLKDTDGVEQMRFLAEQEYAGTLVLMSGYDLRVLGTAWELGQSLGLNIGPVLEKPLEISGLEQMFDRLQAERRTFAPERLREAIANGELSLDFQPVVTRNPRALKKLELLIRWDHPAAGRIEPTEFLPMAEVDTATIDALTDWVIGAAVSAYQLLQELRIDVPLSVNVSPSNLHDLTLPNRIEQALRDGGMPANKLCLEITESAAFKDPGRSMDILSRMRLKGMQLALDDFGTGYSSLTMLRQMPFTEIKIDKSFVTNATTSRDSRIIAKCIVDLAANLGMECVAEGVEDEQTAVLLEELGPCNLQGFHIAKPMPVEAIPVWLNAWLANEALGNPDSASIAVFRRPLPAPSLGQPIEQQPQAIDTARSGAPAGGPRLPPQQLAVMRLLAEGCSVKEIARRLGLGIGTVKVHLSLAYSALGAHNRIEAVMRALPVLERDTTVSAVASAR